MRYFNTEGLCVPNKHYIVDITERIKAIRKYVDADKFLTINRGDSMGRRQL